MITGDAGESFEILFASHRLREAGYIPVIAAPAVRRLNLVIHDFEPGWDTYVERKGYLVESEISFADGTTTALTDSLPSPDNTPMTAASRTSGWSSNTFSISDG